jgi:hypothetical protein
VVRCHVVTMTFTVPWATAASYCFARRVLLLCAEALLPPIAPRAPTRLHASYWAEDRTLPPHPVAVSRVPARDSGRSAASSAATERSAPKQSRGLSSQRERWRRRRRPVQVACGASHTVVVAEDSTVFSWGFNMCELAYCRVLPSTRRRVHRERQMGCHRRYGQLGHGDTQTRSVSHSHAALEHVCVAHHRAAWPRCGRNLRCAALHS